MIVWCLVVVLGIVMLWLLFRRDHREVRSQGLEDAGGNHSDNLRSHRLGVVGYRPASVSVERTESPNFGVFITERPTSNSPIRIVDGVLYMEDGRVISLTGTLHKLRTRDAYADAGFFERDVELLGLADDWTVDYWPIGGERIQSVGFIYIHSIIDSVTGETISGEELARRMGGKFRRW